MSQTAKRLAELGIVLPKPAAPVANYVPFVTNRRHGAGRAVSALCLRPAAARARTGRSRSGTRASSGRIRRSRRRARRRSAARSTSSPRRRRRSAISTRSSGVVRLGGFFNVASSLRRPAPGDERRLRSDGGRFRRARPPRPHHGRRRASAAERAGRGRGGVRDLVLKALERARLADRAADRPSRPA